MARHRWLAIAVISITLLPLEVSQAQGNAFIPALNGQGNGNLLPGGNNQGQFNQQAGPQQNNNGFAGGAANADFDSLIDLIISTVEPDTWVENGGPEADIRPFPTGVWVDASGVLREVEASSSTRLVSLSPPPVPAAGASGNAREPAELRCVSLPRLEAEVYHRLRDGKPLDESMLTLAGLQRIEYVFVYPEIGDVVLAGPAGDWQLDSERHLVSVSTGVPVVRFDDLLTLLRRERDQQHKPFGCAITPRQGNLAATQAFLDRSAGEPLPPGRKARERWLGDLGDTLGRQDIEVFGIDASTHAAHVLVKADHHMKCVGIGLEEGVPGVESYLETVARQRDNQPPLNVLRWWFSTNYTGISQNEAGTAFEFVGLGVCVLSENELLTKRGERVHTGQADDATQQFAHQFTANFDALAARYPVYGELRNLFDLAIVAALLDANDLYATAGWQPVLLLDAQYLPLPKHRTPREVDTIISHRLAGKGKILAAASGGVWIDSQGVLTKRAAPSDEVEYHRERIPTDLAQGVWWWDLE